MSLGASRRSLTEQEDVITFTGKVIDKKQENESNVVRGEVLAKNQKDEVVISGFFEAALPNKK